jgi:predicted phage terminase large subunit-like protein
VRGLGPAAWWRPVCRIARSSHPRPHIRGWSFPSFRGQTVQSWDTANKSTELSDYSVCTTWGVHDRRYYLLDVFRQRLNYPDLKRKVQELSRRDRPNKILIEDRASGTQLIQDLKAEGVHAVTAYQPPAGTDKIMRLHAQTAQFENGRVLLPSRAPWLADYVNELTSFPGSRYDDQVDSTTQALDHLRLKKSMYVAPEVLELARRFRPRYGPFY